MGLFGGKKKQPEKKKEEELPPPPPQPSKPALESPPAAKAPAPAPDANAIFKTETSVFEFGSAASSDEKVTLAGYCPISDEMEPCRWEILPSGGSEAPLFRIIF